MFKKSAIALGLLVACGPVFAAGMSAGGNAMSNGGDAMSSGSAMSGGSAMSSNDAMGGHGMAHSEQQRLEGMSEQQIRALFHRLDTNGNGVLSRSEAMKDPMVGQLYSSMTNDASIESDPFAKKNAMGHGGINIDQFMAGIDAAKHGALGPAVSGGKTYTVMPGQDNMSHDSMRNDSMGHNSMGSENTGGAMSNGG